MVNTLPTIINQINNECLDKSNHNKFNSIGLEEKIEISYLDKEWVLEESKYSKCNRIIVIGKIYNYDKENLILILKYFYKLHNRKSSTN